MYPLEYNIAGLLNKDMGEFHSEDGVVIYLNTNGSVFVIGQFAAHCTDRIDVGICCELGSIDCLIEALAITSRDDFRRLSVRHLCKLYQQGRGELYCSIRDHGDFPLRFRKGASAVKVLDDNDELIESIVCKGTPKEVIDYTYEFFSTKCVLQ